MEKLLTLVKQSNASQLIAPHGGLLVNAIVPSNEAAALRRKAKEFPAIHLTEDSYADLEMIAIGGFSPLTGFFGKDDYQSVVSSMRLANGTLWPVPIVLGTDAETRAPLRVGKFAALWFGEEIVAVIRVEDLFTANKTTEARAVFKTDDENHPGVSRLFARGEFLVGGRIQVLKRPDHSAFADYNFTPRDTRRAFKQNQWKTVVGFQTRNPMHRAHEYLTKTALEMTDGLLIHPTVGQSKAGDIPAEVRMRCYRALLDNYYPAKRVMLAINPANMLYAGPREAVLHAIVRQNYGCTHFIIGRDHAGVGDYYGPYDAQRLIRSVADDLEITPLCFENSFWCRKSGAMSTEKTTNSTAADRIYLSGSKVRELIRQRIAPPPEVTRPEVAKILLEATGS